MPTYEYKREDGTTFEVFQAMSDEPLTECPTTGQPVKRMISGGTGLVFKGSGFYVTDYKNGNGSASSASSGDGKNGSASKKESDSSTTEKKTKSDSGTSSGTEKNNG